MTTSLRRLLEQEAQRTQRSAAPLEDVLSGGGSLVRRRRVVGVAIAAALALIAVVVPLAIAGLGSDTDQPIDRPQCELPLLLGSGYEGGPSGVSIASSDLSEVSEFLPRAGAGGGVGIYPTFSPDGSRIAYVDYVDEMAGAMVQSALVVVAVDTGERQRVTGDGRRVLAPAWSPGGKRLAYTSNRYPENGPGGWGSGKLHVVDADGTGRRTIAVAPGPGDDLSYLENLRWVDDHTLLYEDEGTVWRLDPDAPEPVIPERVVSLDGWDEDSELRISPDGIAAVLAVKVKDTTRLEIVDLESERSQRIPGAEVSDHGTATPVGWTSDGQFVFDRDPHDVEDYEVWTVSEAGWGESTRVATVDEDSVDPHLYAVNPACSLSE